MTIKPTAGRVLVKKLLEEKVGRVLVPRSAQEKEAHCFLAEVLELGPEKPIEASGVLRPHPCQVGDKVLIIAYAGWSMERTPQLAEMGKDLVLLNVEDVTAVVTTA